MIEILVKYIQDKGYEVDVRPGYLSIRKIAKDQLFSISWGIAKFDLHPDLETYLYEVADHQVYQIERAIAEYDGH